MKDPFRPITMKDAEEVIKEIERLPLSPDFKNRGACINSVQYVVTQILKERSKEAKEERSCQ